MLEASCYHPNISVLLGENLCQPVTLHFTPHRMQPIAIDGQSVMALLGFGVQK